MEKTLNRLAKAYLKNVNIASLQPMNLDTEGGVTIFPNTEDAFRLNPPVAGSWRPVQGDVNRDDGAVVRMVMGYTMAARIEQNPETFNYYFSMMLNSGLASLSRELGFLQFREIICERPGTPGVFFKELEEAAAFELRLYVKKKEVFK